MIPGSPSLATEVFMQSSAYSSSTPPKTWLERDWKRFGAESDGKESLDLEEASKYCRELALSHYENFSIASFLIPKHLRRHFFHVYAFCRWSDDLADESSDELQALERLNWWQSQLDDCFQGIEENSENPRFFRGAKGDNAVGSAGHPVMVALRSTVVAFQLSRQPFDDLLSAFRQDQTTQRYETDDLLYDYCRRSANPVGRILLQMAKVDRRECLEWSDHICTGLQLANFCQDMARDAAMHRIYFPRSRWKQDGVTESMILRGRCEPELQKAMMRWMLEIRERFYIGWQLSDHVPAWLARDVRLFAGGGLAILDRIGKRNGDVWSRRIEVSKRDKMLLLLRALISKRIPRVIEFSLPLLKANDSNA